MSKESNKTEFEQECDDLNTQDYEGERASDVSDDEKSEELKDALEEADVKIEELKDKYLRKVAEFDNYVKRTRKEKDELIFNGSEKTIGAILPIIDDMERAIANVGKTDDAKAVEEGWELIYKKFIKVLESLGVKQINTTGQDFDVDYHEAIAMVPGDDEHRGKVIDCVQTGYTLNDKVIRHAKVAVGQ